MHGISYLVHMTLGATDPALLAARLCRRVVRAPAAGAVSDLEEGLAKDLAQAVLVVLSSRRGKITLGRIGQVGLVI
jgi:hypothetical protein